MRHIRAVIVAKVALAMHNHRRLLLACSFAAVFAFHAASAAEPNRRFVVPGNDGYGLADCLKQGSSCGVIVADALCETKGFKKHAAFGELDASDITASVKTSAPATPRGFVVTCAE